MFFEQLSFLAPHVHRNERTTSNIEPPQIQEENTELYGSTAGNELNDSGTITKQFNVLPQLNARRGKKTPNRTEQQLQNL